MPDSVAQHSMNPPYDVCSPLVCNSECMRVNSNKTSILCMWSSNLPFSEAFLFSLLSSNTCLLIGRICAISLSPDWSKPLLVVMWNLNSLSLGTYKKLCLWRKIMLHFFNHFSLLWWDLLVVVCPTTWATLQLVAAVDVSGLFFFSSCYVFVVVTMWSDSWFGMAQAQPNQQVPPAQPPRPAQPAQPTSSQPIRQAPRRLPVHHANEVREHVEQLLAEGLVDPSNSPWAAPIVVVRKPDGAIRLCVDYRKLNAVTVRDAFPIPRIDDAIDNMGDAQYFTTLDLASGYWQVELTNAARAKSAFVTPFELFEWKVMPFGLCNAPATFQRLMIMVLGDLVPSVCSAYIDNTITFSKTFQEHLVRLRLVFEKFRAAGLKVKPRKCQILSKSVTYLGHVFKGGGCCCCCCCCLFYFADSNGQVAQ